MVRVEPVAPQVACFMASIIAQVLNEVDAWFEGHGRTPTRGQFAGRRHLENCYDEYVVLSKTASRHTLRERTSDDVGMLLESDEVEAEKFVLWSLMYACQKVDEWYSRGERRSFHPWLRALCHQAGVQYRKKKNSVLPDTRTDQLVSVETSSSYFC